MKEIIPYVKISEVCEFISGGTPSRSIPDYFRGSIPWITSADLTDDVVTKARDYITEEALRESATKIVPKDNILLVTRTGVGKVAITGIDICISQDFTGLKLNKKKVTTRYLYYFLISQQHYFVSQQRGATIQGITREAVENVCLRLPPLAEQQRIAAILQKADRVRRLRRYARKMSESVLQGVFLEMFGDPERNPKGWNKTKLEDICEIRRGASPRPIDNFLGGNVPWIRIGDGTQGDTIYITSTKDYVTPAGAAKSVYLKAGALIFANCGVSLGFARILKIDGCIHDGWLSFEKINTSEIDPVFLLKTLNQITPYLRSLAPEGTQPNLNTEIMRNFLVITPPMDLQSKYVNIVNYYNRINVQQAEAERQAEHLFQSLLRRAFAGEL